ncbi:MAG: ATP-grasp domain-containing protein, partial [Patescibacteria group bacterium]
MDLKKLSQYLHKKLANDAIVFISPDFKKGIGIEMFLPHYLVIGGYDSPLIKRACEDGLNVIAMESLDPKSAKDAHNSGKILENEKVQNHIRAFQKKCAAAKVHILTFKGNSKIELICKKNKWGLLNLPMIITTKLEDKANFSKLLEKFDGETLPTICGVLNTLNLKKLPASKKYAVQFTRGFGGSSTYFLDIKGIEKLRHSYGDHRVKIAPFVDGPTLTLNGCVYNDHVYTSYPFLQKTGDKKYTRYEGGSCGVDFDFGNKKAHAKKISSAIVKKTVACAASLAGRAKRLGLKGFFGIDAITDGKAVYPVEINPRLTA